MTEWKKCDYCEEMAVTLYNVEVVTQHCYPTLQSQRRICDKCLEEWGIDPDVLARIISAERP